MVATRFHINNLPGDVNEGTVVNYLQKHIGNIFDVSIKNGYGFFSLDAPEKIVNKVISDFHEHKWDNNVVRITKAKKENFMDRLAKERENSHSKRQSNNAMEKKEVDNASHSKMRTSMFRGTKNLEHVLNSDLLGSHIQSDEVHTQLRYSKDANGSDPAKPKKNKRLSENQPINAKVALPQTKEEKKINDDMRRRLCLLGKDKERKRQQDLVQSALRNTDVKKRNRIVFNEEDDCQALHTSRLLFEDEDHEDAITFPVNNHLNSKEGSKMMSLQSKFDDDRFKMNETFLEGDVRSIQATRASEMVRFNPEKTAEAEMYSGISPHKSEVPVLTNDKFYEVSENIKDALRDKTSFSLLSAYGGRKNDEPSREESHEGHYPTKALKVKNPFDDVSSDDDNNWQSSIFKQDDSCKSPVHVLSSSTFFLSNNDPLFAESMEFINKRNSEEAKKYIDGYDETRKVLVRIFRDQTLRRVKSKSLFKNKVGGFRKGAKCYVKKNTPYSKGDKHKR